MEERTTAILSDLTLADLLARLASSDPVPGGGSAAALAGAAGAALVGMVVELTAGRPGSEPHAGQLAALHASSHERRARLMGLAQRDADAYQAVVSARRLPRETDAQRAERRRQLDGAMHAAAEAPLEAARLALEVLADAAAVAPIGNPNAVSDAGVAAQLAAASVRGAVLNVRINLPYLPADDPLRDAATLELPAISAKADELLQTAMAAVEEMLTAP